MLEYQTIIGRRIMPCRKADEKKLRGLIKKFSGNPLASNLTNLTSMEAKGENAYSLKTNVILTIKFPDYQSLQRFTEEVSNNNYIFKGSTLKEIGVAA